MSTSSVRRMFVWMVSMSAVVVVVMGAIWFAQVRFIAQQNHERMIESQKLEIEIDRLETDLENEGSRITAELDSGLCLFPDRGFNNLNLNDELEGPIIGALVRQVKDDRFYVQRHGLEGLIAIKPESHRLSIYAPMVVPAVTRTLKDKRLWSPAVTVLLDYRPHSGGAAPMVIKTLDVTDWHRLTSHTRMARMLDSQCDRVPALVRHLCECDEPWKRVLGRMQRDFTPEEVRQAYQQATNKLSADDPERHDLYSAILRYLNDSPVVSPLLPPPRNVDDYVERVLKSKAEK